MAFTVTYKPNGGTGSVPVDSTNYNKNATVTVLSPGGLSLSGDTFAYWNTEADGSGTVYGPGATFAITSNVTLYAEWYTTKGLTDHGLGVGITKHYAFSYDATLAASGVEPARTNAVIAACESDFTLMSGWFGNIELSPKITTPFPIRVANSVGGAATGGLYPNISTTLGARSGDVAFLRYLIVSEIVEVLMYVQAQGWYAPNSSNEQSCGEALSRFLAQQFLVLTGLGVSEPGFAISSLWLNSSLPPSNANSSQLGSSMTTLASQIDDVVGTFAVVQASTVPFASTYIIQIDNEQMLVTAVDTGVNTLTVTRGYNGTSTATHAAGATVYFNYGSRADYINLTLEYDHQPDAASGCGLLFLYYLQVQLGFTSIAQIIAAAPGVANASQCLRGVYQNLTGGIDDPFPFFRQLLDAVFPPDQVANIPGPNPDNPWPIGSVASINLSSDVLWTGQTVTGTITLEEPSPEDTTVTLSILDGAGVPAPPSVLSNAPPSAVVIAGATLGTFQITAAATATTESFWNILAAGPDGVTKSADLTVLPGQIFVFAPAGPDGPLLPGQTATGTILVRTPAPASGEPIKLSTNHPHAVSISPPAGGVISPGATSATFAVTANSLPLGTFLVNGITISASFAGGSATSATFSVVRKIFQPPPPPPPPGGGPGPKPQESSPRHSVRAVKLLLRRPRLMAGK